MARRLYPGSCILFAAIAAAYALEVARGAVANDAGLLALGALPDAAELDGEFWRWLSFGFLHWDLTHLALNSALLLAAGPIAERRVGSIRLLSVFCAASVASGIAISAKHLLLPSPGASLGASGGMFGLLGLSLVLVQLPPPAHRILRAALGLVTVCGLAYSLLPGISLAGHLAGLGVGGCAALGIRRRTLD